MDEVVSGSPMIGVDGWDDGERRKLREVRVGQQMRRE